MKKYFLSWIVPVVTASLLFFACTKIDQIRHHPSGIGKYCRIESLDVDIYGNSGTLHIQFFYNEAGDPVETRLMNGPFGHTNHFRYDKKGRLTDILFTDPGQTFVYIWDRYSYPSPRMIIDSAYQYQGSVNDPNPPNDPDKVVKITKIQLDEMGRPIRYFTYYSDPNIPWSDNELSYDKNGNLVRPGVTYDDKINIYQTNRVWQLMNGDYSRNNPTAGGVNGLPRTPAAYNKFGLPTKFLGSAIRIFGDSFDTMRVTYSCDVPEGAAK